MAKEKKEKLAVSKKVAKLLRKVEAHILEEPKRFEMSSWFSRIDNPNDPDEVKQYPKCGTTACIAGWVTLLGMPNIKKDKHGFWIPPRESVVEKFATKALGLRAYEDLSYAERDAVGDDDYVGETLDSHVFHQENWPEPFRSKFYNEEHRPFGSKKPPSKKRLAKIAVQRLEYFIHTGK